MEPDKNNPMNGVNRVTGQHITHCVSTPTAHQAAHERALIKAVEAFRTNIKNPGTLEHSILAYLQALLDDDGVKKELAKAIAAASGKVWSEHHFDFEDYQRQAQAALDAIKAGVKV